MMIWVSKLLKRTRSAPVLRRFVRDEDGTIILLTLVLLIPMIYVGGIAVDFMRFEARRAQLQGITDQAALATANLKQSLDAKTVIVDYFTKAGAAANLNGDPIITSGVNSREVTINSYVDIKTYFMDIASPFLGQLGDTSVLRANAVSTAVQGTGKIEVSLVLDISGSMYEDVPGTVKKRMQLVTEAAESFLDRLLDPAFKDRISVSLIPYSERVNAGPNILNALNVDSATRHDFSHCVEFDPTEYQTTVFDTTSTYKQSQPVQFNPFGYGSDREYSNSGVDQPICPRFSYEQIVPLSQNVTDLKSRVSQLKPRAGTSIFMGMKWATALLDPSFNTVVQAMPSGAIDPAFLDRPTPYEQVRGSNTQATLKYVVLLTDGTNSRSCRLADKWVDTPSELNYFARVNLDYVRRYLWNISNECSTTNPDAVFTQSPADGDGYLIAMCDAAKARGIEVFTISVTGTDTSTAAIAGREIMKTCATKPANFFASSGSNLDSIFEAISNQITELRLTQ
ncbi:pilus assembly protein TadG-related protein [Loktanella sp. SALINAS62]|uniref:TadE/TadG family type IV pilus assembly protein n=1 Tax=Loktanella sp. SALINAS62 TaxID=2706124 RepID=UPI001B8C10CC|nr:pilus assembly protein TadG-related protein [Loktanella sp. SALINAS62]MBS1303871.1 VWA domain-containing protein [Loktanella sp. SALINAS62]